MKFETDGIKFSDTEIVIIIWLLGFVSGITGQVLYDHLSIVISIGVK